MIAQPSPLLWFWLVLLQLFSDIKVSVFQGRETESETNILNSYSPFFCVFPLDSLYTLLLVIYFLLDFGLVEAIYDGIFSFRNVNCEDDEQV